MSAEGTAVMSPKHRTRRAAHNGFFYTRLPPPGAESVYLSLDGLAGILDVATDKDSDRSGHKYQTYLQGSDYNSQWWTRNMWQGQD